MKRMVNVLFSPDFFKISFFLVSILGVCPLVSANLEPFLKIFHFYALIVIIFDLIGEKRILRNKGRFFLVLFVLFYTITLLNNRNLLNFSGISNYLYLFEVLAIVYSYGEKSEKYNQVATVVLCSLVSLANLVGIWMFFSKFHIYIPDRGYIGMFPMENRLAGLFGNPNVLGMICLGAICLCAVEIVRCNQYKNKCYFAVLGAINLVALLLSNSRTQMYSMVLFFVVFSFMIILKSGRDIKHMLFAVGVSGMCAMITLTGFRLLQRSFSLLDWKYDYYLQNIDLESSQVQMEEESAKEETVVEEKEGVETEAPAVKDSEIIYTGETSPEQNLLDEQQKPDEDTERIGRLETKGLNGRVDLWNSGYKLFLAKPIFGNGMDNHNASLSALGYEELPVKGNLHNVYLDVIVCFGIAGFGCLMVYLFMMFGNVIVFFKYNDGKTWFLGAVLLASMAAFMLDGVADSTLVASFYPTAVAFWFIASQFAELLEKENSRTGHYHKEFLWRIIDMLFSKKG